MAGKAAGKVMGIFLAAVLLGVLLICVWTIRLEFTPIRLTIRQKGDKED